VIEWLLCLSLDDMVIGFRPGRGLRMFKGGKHMKYDCLRRGSKAVGPMSKDFAAC
jgi:hypothetical protein